MLFSSLPRMGDGEVFPALSQRVAAGQGSVERWSQVIHVSTATSEGALHSRPCNSHCPGSSLHSWAANLQGQPERGSGGKGGINSPPIEGDFICFHLLLVFKY